MSRSLSNAARALGRKGGRAGAGAAKRRSPEHYAAMQARAVHARRVTAARKELAGLSILGQRDLARAIIAGRWGDDVLRDAECEGLDPG